MKEQGDKCGECGRGIWGGKGHGQVYDSRYVQHKQQGWCGAIGGVSGIINKYGGQCRDVSQISYATDMKNNNR